MSAIKEPGSSGLPTKDHPTSRAQDARGGAHYGQTFRLQNSTVTIEPGLRGPLARIVRRDTVDYAGPLSDATLAALREVASNG